MNQSSDNSTVVDDSLDGKVKLGFVLRGVNLSIFGEALLLGFVPVFVESSLDFIREFLGPDGAKGSEASWCLDVTDHTGNFHGRGFNDGDSLIDFLLVQVGVWSVDVSQNVGHTGLESHEGGEMWVLGGIISWEGSDLTSMLSGSFSWEESEGSVSWASKLSMRHIY